MATGGWLEKINELYTSIEIWTDPAGAGNLTLQGTYRLDYTPHFGEKQLTSVVQVEACGACATPLERELASFEYYDMSTGTASTVGVVEPVAQPSRSLIQDPLLPALGGSSSQSAGAQSENTPWAMLTDMSGDGLPDYLHTRLDGGYIYSSWQLFDWANTAPTSHFEPPEERLLLPEIHTGNGLGDTRSMLCSPEESATYALKRMIDLDGDGFVDRLFTDAIIPEPYYPGDPLPGWCHDKNVLQTTTWDVAWGGPNGFSSSEAMTSPVPFLRVGGNPKLPDLGDPGVVNIQDFYDQEDAVMDLVDMNGDGWADILWHGADPNGEHTLYVYLANPGTNAWETTPIDWTPDYPMRQQLKSTSLSRAEVDQTELEVVAYEENGQSVMAEDSSLVVSHTYGLSRLTDINGDGLTDYLFHTGAAWDVYFGTPTGFVHGTWSGPAGYDYLSKSDEGRSWLYSCTIPGPPPYDPRALSPEEGPQPPALATLNCGASPQMDPLGKLVLAELLDVDGDGRQDFVDTEAGLWFRNSGGGFRQVGEPLPDVFGTDPISDTHVWVVSIHNADDLQEAANNNEAYFEDYISRSSNRTVEFSRILDIDRDGRLDRVYTANAGSVLQSENTGDFLTALDEMRFDVLYGRHHRQGLLKKVHVPTGGETELRYVSSSWAWPSGEPDEDHLMATRKDLLWSTETIDPITGHQGFTHYTYAGGQCFDGKCTGFDTTTVEEWRHDPLLSQPGTYTRIGITITDWLLDRDFQVPERRQFNTPIGNPWDPSVVGSSVRAVEEIDYGQLISTNGGVWTLHAARPWIRTITDHADDGSSRTFEVRVERNAEGLPIEVHHTYADDPTQDISSFTTYTSNGNGSLYVPIEQTTQAYDVVAQSHVDVETIRFSYDGDPWGQPISNGLLTDQEVWSGRPDIDLGLESLHWSFTRDPDRGQIVQIDAPAGSRKTTEAFAFGGALTATERITVSSGDQVTDTEYDGMGRATRTIDPNGMIDRTEYDGFGRAIATYTQAVGGAEYQTSSTQYLESSVPFARQVTTYDYVTAGATADVSTAVGWLDGFGSPWQNWTQNDVGNWVVEEVDRDITGVVVRESYPHVEDAFVTDPFSVQSNSWAKWIERDGMGIERLEYADHKFLKGLVTRTVPEPGAVLTEDANQYLHLSRHDTHGRMVELEEGRNGLTSVTARYLYDGMGRVALVEDAKADQHRYAYDGTGRLRQVWRRAVVGSPVEPTPAGCPIEDSGIAPTCAPSTSPLDAAGWTWEPYFAYTYDGPNPVEMFEGTVQGTLVTEWAWDELGRQTWQRTLDRSTGALDHEYTWSWDVDPVDPNQQWLGVVFQSTDPAGTTVNQYLPDGFGGRGLLTGQIRTWDNDPFVGHYGYSYDSRGRVTQEVLPSATVVQHTYAPGDFKIASTVQHSNGTDQVDYLYDDFGLEAGFMATTHAGQTYVMDEIRVSPATLQGRAWSTSQQALDHTLDYTYHLNHMLAEKVVDGTEPIVYSYDDRQRVTSVVHDGHVLESFLYDAAGNPTDSRRAGANTWAYQTSGIRFHDIPSRSALGGDVENYRYDGWSRLTNWSTMVNGGGAIRRTLRYDGLGRLEQLRYRDGAGVFQEVAYAYTGDNQLAEETRVDGIQINRILRHAGARYETATGELIEETLPMLRTVDGGASSKWVFHDLDGHALAVYDQIGTEETFELSGIFGAKLDPQVGTYPLDYFQGSDWKLDGVHGGQLDRTNNLVHRGQRHALLDDGRWLQPEPMLAAGITNADLGRPGSFSGVYAGGNPLIFADNTGYYFESAIDIASLAVGAVSFASNVKEGNYGAAALDAVGMVADGAALVVPGVPGGAGLAIDMVRHGDEAASVVAAGAKFLLGKSDNVTDVATTATKGGACFIAGTNVITPDGSQAIETVAVGDLVLAHDEATGRDTIGKVTRLFVRVAPAVIDAEIAYASGSSDTLTGTPNHPFWVDAVRDYVPLGELEVGTVLHVQGGGEAILVSKTWRQGDFEVFDFEVEGLHNFYVRGEGSEAAGVLVHNSTPAKGLHQQAEAARDALSDSFAGQKHKPATVVGAYSESTGQVTAQASRGGGRGCAEGACAEALGNPADIQFTTAKRPRTGGDVPVCENCESTYGRDAFPDRDTTFKSDETP